MAGESGKYLYIIPVLLFFALLYFLLPFFIPPQPGFGPAPQAQGEPECSAGSEISCITPEGCAGYRPCILGRQGACEKRLECTPGETEPCTYSSCVEGERECDACGKWGRCVPPPGCEIGYCPVINDTY
jgi:hypothetical protein